ncbi:hypothetical protein FWH09_03075 [Candidatus Saccharibacteria bacterium]|nr:hypothetical protein [Candidatus Saccharibacteria bacterium]
MDKRGIRRDAPRKFMDNWVVMFFVTLFVGALAIGISAYITYTALMKSGESTSRSNDEATTDDLNRLFEAFGLARESMPDVLPVMQGVNGRVLRVEAQNMLYNTKVDETFPGRRNGWVAVSLQLRVENHSSQSIRIADHIKLLVDSFQDGFTDASAAFLREYNMTNLNNNATLEGGQAVSGFVTFYVRASSVSNMYLQVDASASGESTSIDLSIR